MMKHAEGCWHDEAWECQLASDHTKVQQKQEAGKDSTISTNSC